MSVDAVDSIFFNHNGQEIYAEKCGVHMGYLHEQRSCTAAPPDALLPTVLERLGEDAVVLGAGVRPLLPGTTGVTLEIEPRRPHRASGTRRHRRRRNQVRDPQADAPRSAPSRTTPASRCTAARRCGPDPRRHTILHIGDPRISTMIIYPIADDFEGTGKSWSTGSSGTRRRGDDRGLEPARHIDESSRSTTPSNRLPRRAAADARRPRGLPLPAHPARAARQLGRRPGRAARRRRPRDVPARWQRRVPGDPRRTRRRRTSSREPRTRTRRSSPTTVRAASPSTASS